MRRVRRAAGLSIAIAVALGAACAPAVVRTRPEQPVLFETGTFDEAAQAMPFKVPRPSHLPDGASLVAVEFAAQPDLQWVVQRYRVGEHSLYVKSELAPDGFSPAVDRALTIKGRPAVVSARRAPDGSIIEWLVYLRIGPALH